MECPAPHPLDRKTERVEVVRSLHTRRFRRIPVEIERRARRFRNGERIQFLDANSSIPGTQIKVADAREGRFHGSEIPTDLRRQWMRRYGDRVQR